MSDAGSTKGTGSDWRFIFIFSLKTGKRVGKFNWYMFDRSDLAEFATFVDAAREAHGVEFPPIVEPE